jgi:long-chain fatty acid transport protein
VFQYKKLAAAMLVAGVVGPGAAFATDGYFQPGYSVISSGMGGVGIALPQDALAAAANPAGMVDVGNRLDGGISLFKPNRGATVSGLSPSPQDFGGNDTSSFLIPEFGVNRMYSPNLALGLDVYGNGGMNSGYSSIGSSGLPLMNGAGVDLQQMFIAPTLSYRINAENNVGIALNLVHQTFRANGLGAFAQTTGPFAYASSNPANVTDKGHDSSNGVGVRLGWQGKIAPGLTVGATVQPKTHMSSFSAYSGLFAGGGSMDIPANYGVGVAFKPNDQLTLAGDVERIDYAGVPSIGNSLACFLEHTCQLGAANGPGFGWTDITVVKLGVAYAINPALTVRAGWNHSGNPVPGSQVLLNTLAPGIVENHLTLGGSYALNPSTDISVDYVHAFKNTVTGGLPTQFGYPSSASETLHMDEDTVGVAIGWKF